MDLKVSQPQQGDMIKLPPEERAGEHPDIMPLLGDEFFGHPDLQAYLIRNGFPTSEGYRQLIIEAANEMRIPLIDVHGIMNNDPEASQTVIDLLRACVEFERTDPATLMRHHGEDFDPHGNPILTPPFSVQIWPVERQGNDAAAVNSATHELMAKGFVNTGFELESYKLRPTLYLRKDRNGRLEGAFNLPNCSVDFVKWYKTCFPDVDIDKFTIKQAAIVLGDYVELEQEGDYKRFQQAGFNVVLIMNSRKSINILGVLQHHRQPLVHDIRTRRKWKILRDARRYTVAGPYGSYSLLNKMMSVFKGLPLGRVPEMLAIPMREDQTTDQFIRDVLLGLQKTMGRFFTSVNLGPDGGVSPDDRVQRFLLQTAETAASNEL